MNSNFVMDCELNRTVIRFKFYFSQEQYRRYVARHSVLKDLMLYP